MNAMQKRIIDKLNTLSYATIFVLWGASVIIFALIYFTLSYSSTDGLAGLGYASPLPRMWAAIYFSIITATNTGYGDIAPLGFSRLFAAVEAVSGLFLFALFMAKLVSLRQDLTIQHMHRLSFEGTFHDVREDLHMIRGDFDKIIGIVREEGTLGVSEWKLLRVAYQHATSLVRDIPHFYDPEHHLYHIDARREMLLIEAVERTLHRLDGVLDVFGSAGIDWKREPDMAEQLHKLMSAFDAVLPRWKVAATRASLEGLETLSNVVAAMKARLA